MPVPGLTETPAHDVWEPVAVGDDADEGLGLTRGLAEEVAVAGAAVGDGLGEIVGLGEIDGQFFPWQPFTTGLAPPEPFEPKPAANADRTEGSVRLAENNRTIAAAMATALPPWRTTCSPGPPTATVDG